MGRPTQQEASAAFQSGSALDVLAQDACMVDLTTSESPEDDLPPPPYGDSYGEIRNEKDGLGTSANVTDDGRVDIRINQLNRRLSHIFSPALSHHLQSIQDSSQEPPPYISPSLRGKDGAPPLALNVVIHVVGSRGDVQPFVALGKVLRDTYGHRVRLATHPKFRAFVLENSLEFFSIGCDPSRLMAYMSKNPNLMPGIRSLSNGDVGQRRKDVSEYIQGCWRSCYETGDGLDDNFDQLDLKSTSAPRPFVADCIIANPPSFAHIHCAEKLGVPLHIMFTMPYSPTQAFPHPLANVQSSNADPQLTNYLSYAMIEGLSWQGVGDIVNRFRSKCLGLDPISVLRGPGVLQRLRIPHTYAWSPALIPKPKDWGAEITISGFYLLNQASSYTPNPQLQSFLDAGPPPVYIGFGSIYLEKANAMTALVLEATKKTGQRILLSQGWGGMGAQELDIDRTKVFILGDVPHDWLFKHVSCLVHHGGAGTTAAGMTAGRPTVVVPFFGDQPFWGGMVSRAGAGPAPIPHNQLTADKLADAINFCLEPRTQDHAKDLADTIASERGTEEGAQSFHHFLDVDRLRCLLAPSRPAVWRVRRTKVRLSTFAACTLANANLLDFNDLKLFRAQEYETDAGPTDPISGAFVAACDAVGTMTMALVETPSETWKAMQLPFKAGQQDSQTSNAGRQSMSSESAATSQTSLNLRGGPSDTRIPLVRSKSTASPSTKDDKRSQLRSRQGRTDMPLVKSLEPKNKDMLRHSGAHLSKGAGSFAKALVQSPMTLSMGLTRGCHNLPKMWGDETVRPQAQVKDAKSGFTTAGKQFGLGWYDGITGLVTQPWQGAQKDGVGGLVAGIGKGVAGFIAKPLAGSVGILGYPMKGLHRQVQNTFNRNLQTYISASRAAQGYEEWQQSSEAEKQDVVERWSLIQKYLKNKSCPDEFMRDILETHYKARNSTMGEPHRSSIGGVANARPLEAGKESVDPQDDSGASTASLMTAAEDEGSQSSSGQSPPRDTSSSGSTGSNKVYTSQTQIRRKEVPGRQASEGDMRQALAASEEEAKRRATEESEYDRHVERLLAQTLLEHRDADSHAWAYPDLTEDVDDMSMNERMAAEKTEEDIVMEYVRKQSLLEAHHRHKGKSARRSTWDDRDDEDDEELQRALQKSLQEHEGLPTGSSKGAPSRL
ncbi:hypothetical protein BDZ85DRAFT_264741 [Elsinoe ampelina]|uniref:Uncharacterized protein n=1 Tax=Elsinoe ampelina TaxID=302913 RepID=A0A6A6G8W5_9PEZI|nr:hypothetical protein BDZ85DRAFT_264741 [Elsinoe ampelina]